MNIRYKYGKNIPCNGLFSGNRAEKVTFAAVVHTQPLHDENWERAERAIVDLKNKVLNVAAISESTPGIFAEVAENIDEAVSALTILGYPKAACEKIVKSICRENPAFTAEAIIRQALTQL